MAWNIDAPRSELAAKCNGFSGALVLDILLCAAGIGGPQSATQNSGNVLALAATQPCNDDDDETRPSINGSTEATPARSLLKVVCDAGRASRGGRGADSRGCRSAWSSHWAVPAPWSVPVASSRTAPPRPRRATHARIRVSLVQRRRVNSSGRGNTLKFQGQNLANNTENRKTFVNMNMSNRG